MSTPKPNPQPGNLPNREELLMLAIEAAKNNNPDGAKMMFLRVLQQDRNNERAMMWMAKLADNKSERIEWLEKVLALNPNNLAAKQALDRIRYRGAASENRTLVVFGVVAAVLVVILLVVFLLLATGGLG